MCKIFLNALLWGLLLASGFCVPLSAVVFHTIDTTSPLLCTFSFKFQNRVMIEKGNIQKVIAADEDRLSIFTDPLSGQIFIHTRDYAPLETTLSIVAENGTVQDLQITFVDRSSETVILIDTLEQEEETPVESEPPAENTVLAKVGSILRGYIPPGYWPCPRRSKTWKPKKGMTLENIQQLEGEEEVLYLYQVTNLTSQPQSLIESELQRPGYRWVFLETHTLEPKQKILCIIAVERYVR